MPNEDEIGSAFDRLRQQVESEYARRGLDEQVLREARDEAERFWPVTAERRFLVKPGLGGRVRGLLLTPVKLLLRPLMRWYVEPPLAEQRRFNAAVLQMLDELVREQRKSAGGREL